jgi:hypothetical protein
MNKKHLAGYAILAAAFTVFGAIAGVGAGCQGTGNDHRMRPPTAAPIPAPPICMRSR